MYHMDATEIAYKNGYDHGKSDATKWIPIDERLPKEGVPVLTYRPCSFIPIMVDRLYNGAFCFSLHLITHWMHLPVPPKVD